MANFNEHALEMSIMELFKDEGYTYVSGDQIHRERTEVLLTDDLKQYLYNRYAKDGITPSEVDSVIPMLRNISGTIYEANKAVFKLLCDGFILNREDRTQKDLYIELIDFDTPENNIFKVVNQFEIEGVNNQLRIPDGIVFVNGIPVVVLEFKSAVQENTTIMDAYKQPSCPADYGLPDIKYRHRDRKGMADDPDCHPHLEKVFKEHPGVDVVHVVLFRQHGDQLITKYKCDNHTSNRYNDRLGKILYHAVNAAIPALRCLPNLSSNLTGLFIDIGIHCCQVGTYHACQKIPHPFFNRFKYPIHESSPS